MGQPQHTQQALQLLHLLVQNIPLCQLLHAGLDEALQPESGAATVPSQAVRNSDAQGQTSGHSASSPMDVDADHANDSDQPTRYLQETTCVKQYLLGGKARVVKCATHTSLCSFLCRE